MTDNALRLSALVSYLEHDATPTILLDPDYNILSANSAYQARFGGNKATHIGQKCYRVSHQYSVPCDQAGEHCPMKRASETKTIDRVLHIHHTPRGPEHVAVELRPILDDASTIIAYVERLSEVSAVSAQPRDDGLVGRSESFNLAIAALQRAAPSQIPVLLQGESGTGKELFATALHRASPRARGPFVIVDCTGLSETLFESEIFGHERGSFTGASARKVGLAETAHGGTLFLDEIGDVPLPMQVKLLRLIESGTFRRVGANETQHSDFRLVAATHKPLEKMVEQGLFRQDLYYRLSGYPIHLPALRERQDDIALLAESLLRRMGPGRPSGIHPEAIKAMRAYPFPGNIRELRNILERARLFVGDGEITTRELPLALLEHAAAPPRVAPPPVPENMADALSTFSGTRSELARKLGLSERTLYRRLRSSDKKP
ncbi:Fis family sigma54 specific transcriptional regulator [Panacagrimonas perspica]|uniref:Fis family sigma54 specific transcriptional regulator n=1 Tax=Panacagrimonas perspica TaxID=381431 RepID=A0A4R7NZC0_9GAMM|nr:sigma 54-interacting transcriptional regulator [Panacagrimonas perspica]TDU26488.1 Fis family sigma54 specific transcriptional regulator [Panacagrimonas perspica]THD02103.1 Fis family transcriptional regulator [Panacagrimonas perspica]